MTAPARDALSTYGGALNDYFPVTDPTTDRSAAAVNQAYASTAMMTCTAVRAWAKFTGAATTGAMVLNSHMALWGNDVSVAPVLARSSTGVYTITWPTTVTDSLLVVQTLSLLGSQAPNVQSATLRGFCTVSGAVATVTTMNTTTGTLTDATSVVVEVFVF